MNRKDKLILDLLCEVEDLEKQLKSIKREFEEIITIKDKQIEYLKHISNEQQFKTIE